ncbi:hypothetical protein LZC95_13750 [Pendulispora brunnea]|uniref:Uncharacterized protein n=1 Tax=Pendulispora brunnea TaxID=2905690 RepID=A0ABZ2KGT7_9BACT
MDLDRVIQVQGLGELDAALVTVSLTDVSAQGLALVVQLIREKGDIGLVDLVVEEIAAEGREQHPDYSFEFANRYCAKHFEQFGEPFDAWG